jgi:prepilin peptidase CpaA
MSSEFVALLELLDMLVFSPRTGVLMALLVTAAVVDARTGRIPNWLVLGGALYGVLHYAFFPINAREVGIEVALGGLAIGLVALLPLYFLRVMGAGDVKLMAMTGAFLGPMSTVSALLATLLAGGLLAMAITLRSGQFARMLGNVAGLTMHQGACVGKMPYAVAIAAGTIGYLVAAQLGFIGAAWS